MGLLAKDSGGGEGFEPLPMGTHVGRCVTVADMGVQQGPYGGKEKIYLGFEVPSVRVAWEKDGQQHEGPAFIGSRYTLSIHEKSILGQHLTSWRGVAFTDAEREGFDVFAVLGAPCMLSVIHTTKGTNTYANIQSIMRMPKGMQAAAPESPQIAYTPMDQDKMMTLDKLPPWLQKVCREGYNIAEGQFAIGSAGAPAPHQPPPAANQAPPNPPPIEQQLAPPASHQPPQTAAQAMEQAMGNNPPPDDFDDDIPF